MIYRNISNVEKLIKFQISGAKYMVKLLPQMEMSFTPIQEVSNMAKNKKSNKPTKPVKKTAGRPAGTTSVAEATKGKTPSVIHLPNKLRARVRLTCMALNTNLNAVARELFAEWVKSKKKALASVVNVDDSDDDDEEEEVEEVETDEEEEVEEEEEEEEEEEDED